MIKQAMQKLTWKDLIGLWRAQYDEERIFDLSIQDNGNYFFTIYKDDLTYQGIITSKYHADSNTVTLNIEGYGEIEVWMLHNNGITIKIEGNKHFFEKLT